MCRANFSPISPSDKKAEIDILAAEYISTVKTLSPDQRVERLQKIQNAYSKCKEYSDDKVQLAMQTYEMVRAGQGPRHPQIYEMVRAGRGPQHPQTYEMVRVGGGHGFLSDDRVLLATQTSEMVRAGWGPWVFLRPLLLPLMQQNVKTAQKWA